MPDPYPPYIFGINDRGGEHLLLNKNRRGWVIGNEMNLANERLGGPTGQVITPELYVTCFSRCRNEIRRRRGHENDQVVTGAMGPWNTQTTYPGNLGVIGSGTSPIS